MAENIFPSAGRNYDTLQLHPPTGIDHCLYCRFANPDEENLVIAGVNQIHVYRLNEDLEVSVKPRDDKAGEKSQDAKAKKCRLECIASYQLFGNIMSMASVRLAGSQTDALVISIKDAKLSIIEYDPSTHDVKTSSMHYFENDDLKDGFIQHSCHIPYLRIDPEGRCAAMLVYRSRLVILPFRKDTLPVDESGSGIPGPG
ncbi:hypothetical protein LSH36_428g00028 [Paralvinella palmiformis]|uniref:RSE1/DDB1/CPSF1 first beta-propeller domain-containing protein n=1 Tax=Paralvinella palmiformis TaxID=53620 RepID=A0AAD9MZK0_9ANNE|nr:hypothetical protein LSH36_428g00028 [Paralvinella palmiformis]